MKKIICLMLCAAMVLGVAGCMRQTPETAIHNYFKEIKKTVTLTLNLKVDSEQSLAVVEKFFEILFCYADVNIIINLNCYTNAITLADAKTTGKCNFVFQMMIRDGVLKKFHDLGGAFQMAGTTNTNCNYHNLPPNYFSYYYYSIKKIQSQYFKT